MPPDEIQRSLGRIEGAITGISADIAAMRQASLTDRNRITSLEMWRAFLAGAWFVTSAVVAYLIKER